MHLEQREPPWQWLAIRGFRGLAVSSPRSLRVASGGNRGRSTVA